ncbi:MAG TPA: polysaccharide deacetylase family protein [Acidimicrobiia bacterium]|nr:polysaccharide deacetylase family protein [Acidimicrobiia bacterium]
MADLFPGGASKALSLTFDDARPSQLAVAVPMFAHYRVSATFYVLAHEVRSRLEAWQHVAASGHEIGNHTSTHPCSANHHLVFVPALEEFTLRRITADIDRASDDIEDMFGFRPATFAYPCGQSFVGRGTSKASFVPVVARRFTAGRGYRGENPNDPALCDLAELDAYQIDGLTPTELVELVDDSAPGSWVVLVGHDIGEGGESAVDATALEALCRHLATDRRIWVAPVRDVARHILETVPRQSATPSTSLLTRLARRWTSYGHTVSG